MIERWNAAEGWETEERWKLTFLCPGALCLCGFTFVGVHAQGRVLVTGYGCSRKLETCTSLSRGQVSLCVSFFSYIPDHDDNIHPVFLCVCEKSQLSVNSPDTAHGSQAGRDRNWTLILALFTPKHKKMYLSVCLSIITLLHKMTIVLALLLKSDVIQQIFIGCLGNWKMFSICGVTGI